MKKKVTKRATTSRRAEEVIARLPAFRAYLDRLEGELGSSAEQRNLRRWVFKQEGKDHYHFDAVMIQLDLKNKTVSCRPREYAPTADEAKDIAKELAAIDGLPTTVPVNNTTDLLKTIKSLGRDKPELYEFKNAGGKIIFVQERIRKDLDDKDDLPWSFWSDGKWRCMEPDGDLPLYGLEQLSGSVHTVMLHEGAPCAHRVLRFEDSRAHPWCDDLWGGSRKKVRGKFKYVAGIAHIGWPGGAPNPHRVDWSPIDKLPPHVKIIVICDNDLSGEEAAPKISRILQRPLRVLRFGEQFPPHFDLADGFPIELWRERKGIVRYEGPKFEDCLGPGTWATRKEGKAYKLREEFVGEWYYCITPENFMTRDRVDQRWSAEEFNAVVAPYSDAVNVAALLRKYQSPQAKALVYEPGQTPGRIAFEGQQVINVYRPSPVVAREGDVAPFLDYMRHLIPEEADRNELCRWCATLIARPDIKMVYSVLLISQTHGVGKSTLGEKILVPLVGRSNSSTPNASEIANPDFTHWQSFTRLAFVEELYEAHAAKAYNQLKAAITAEHLRIRELYDKPFQINNYLHIFGCSNSFRALKIDTGDRRWLIPGVTEQKRDKGYWARFNAWLDNGGREAIAHWAAKYVKDVGYVAPGEEAPMSEAKRHSVRAGLSDGERIIVEVGEKMAKLAKLASSGQSEEGLAEEIGGSLIERMRTDGRHVVRLDELRKWLGEQKRQWGGQYGEDGTRYLETSERIAHLLRQCGLSIFPQRPAELYKGGVRFRVAANFEPDKGTKWSELEQHELPPSLFERPW